MLRLPWLQRTAVTVPGTSAVTTDIIICYTIAITITITITITVTVTVTVTITITITVAIAITQELWSRDHHGVREGR